MSAMSEYYRIRGIRRGQEEFDETAEAVAIKRRQDQEYNEINQPVRLQESRNRGKRLGRVEQAEEAGQPNVMRGIEMKGEEQVQTQALRGLEYPEQITEARHTPEVRNLERPEEMRQAKVAPRINQAKERAEISKSKRSVQKDKIDTQYGNRQMSEEEGYQDMEEYGQILNQSIHGAEQSGNMRYLEDAYEMLVPDGESIKIQDMGDGKIFVTHSGGVSKVTTKEQFIQDTKAMFEGNPKYQEHLANRSGMGSYQSTMGAGYGGSGSRRGSSNRRGRGGFRGEGVAEREWRAVYAAISQLPENEGLSEAELQMKAHAIASQKAGTDPREAVSKFYESQVESLLDMEPRILRKLLGMEENPTMNDILSEAERMSDDYQRKYYGDAETLGRTGIGRKETPAKKPGEGVNRGTAKGEPSPTNIRILLDNPKSERHWKHFNNRYGDGAAEKILEEYAGGEIL